MSGLHAPRDPAAPPVRRPRVGVLVHSVFTVRFFLIPHLKMLAEQYDVFLFVKNDNDEVLRSMDLPVQVIEIPIERKVDILADLRALVVIAWQFHKVNLDLVHTMTAKGGLLGILAAFFVRVPRRIHTFQGEIWPHFSGPKRAFFRFLDWLVVRLATDITVVSFSERDFLRAEGVLPPGAGKVLGAGSICGVDIGRFAPDPATGRKMRRDLGIRPDEFVFLFLGRLSQDKGLHILSEAFDQVREQAGRPVRLLVVGPDEDDLGAGLRASLGHSVIVLPFTDKPEQYIAASDVLVLPSFREGFGMVLIEAAAMGVPAIASDIYGISCAVENHRTGLLVPVANPGALAVAMTSLLTDAALLRRLGEQARERSVRDFEQQTVIQHFRRFYEASLASPVGQGGMKAWRDTTTAQNPAENGRIGRPS